MPDLREQLGQRLFEVVLQARHRQVDLNTPYCEAQKTEYWDLANECIRQMEWTRTSPRHTSAPDDLVSALKEAGRQDHSMPGRPGVGEHPHACPRCLCDFAATILGGPLTAAPDDWRVP
jgi:hypothetical protein